MIGKVIGGKYKIKEEIKRSSTSIIYKAENIVESKIVALKIILENLRNKDISNITLFKQQMRHMVGLRSVYIVNVFDVVEEEGFPVVVNEYIEGETLEEYLERKKIGIEDKVERMIEILKGVEFLHQEGIIHRDLKPTNIMIEAKSGKAKVGDFGTSLLLDLLRIEKEIETTGTVLYMSPEATGMLKKTVDFRSDLYSLGVIF